MEQFQNFKDRDPFILVSLINTKLRDFNPSLDDFVYEYDVNREALLSFLEEFGFCYDLESNQFKRK